MNFVVQYLQQNPDDKQPIIVPFNPWLLSGHQNITRRFFEQLQNVLSKESSVPKGLKERLADFATAISDTPLPYAQTGKALAVLSSTLCSNWQGISSIIRREGQRSWGIKRGSRRQASTRAAANSRNN